MDLKSRLVLVACCVGVASGGSAQTNGTACSGGVVDTSKLVIVGGKLPAGASGPTVPQNQPLPIGPVRISGGVMAGLLRNRVMPVYPPEAKAAHVGGTVVLHAIIGKDGSIENVRVISGPEILQNGAIDAVSQWEYQPYLLNGEPTEVDTTITVNFHLEAPPAAPGERVPGSLPASITDPPSPPPPPTGISGPSTQAVADSMSDAGRVSGGQLRSETPPVYPEEARRQHIGGKVVLRIIVSTKGSVKHVEVTSGPQALWQAATDSVSQWKYSPFLLDGKPIEKETTVTVDFGSR